MEHAWPGVQFETDPAQPAARPASHPEGGLDVTDLTVERGGRTVLEAVGFSVPVASYTCVLGASGSGKSTLLAVIAGTVKPRRGRIEIDGEAVNDAARGICLPSQLRRLGMVFQDYLLWPHLTAADNVALPMRRRLGRVRAKTRARDWLARVGLGGMDFRYPAELSGGQQQRVALARALALEPQLVLLDEPLSALDAQTRNDLRALLRRLAAENRFTAVHVTHDAQEALALADRLVVIDHGSIAQCDAAEEVYRHPATPEVAHLTGTARLIPVQVMSREGGQIAVRLGDRILHVAASDALRAGDEAWLVLRPQALSCTSMPRAIPLAGRLVDACFLGDRWQIEAEIAAAHARVVFWHACCPQPDFELFLIPDHVWAVPRAGTATVT